MFIPREGSPAGDWSAPERLNEEVLAQLAAQFAQHSQLNDKIPPGLAWDGTKQAAHIFGKACFRELLGWYGNDRWPVSAFLRRRFERIRSKQRVIRGLSSL